MTDSQQHDDHILPDIDTMWEYTDPATTAKKFMELVPTARISGSPSYYLQLLTQIARAEGLQGKFDDARTTLREVEKEMSGEMPVVFIRYHLEFGRILNYSGNHEKAKPHFLQAWETAKTTGEEYFAVDAAYMMATAETDPERQLKWSLEALDTAENATQHKAKNWLGPLYNNIGWIYHSRNEFEKALEYFRKNLKWRRDRNDEKGAINARWSMGKALRSMNKLEEALEIQKELAQEIEQKQMKPDGQVFEEIAECLLGLNKNEVARIYFKLAYDQLAGDAAIHENEPERLQRLKYLAGLTTEN